MSLWLYRLDHEYTMAETVERQAGGALSLPDLAIGDGVYGPLLGSRCGSSGNVESR